MKKALLVLLLATPMLAQTNTPTLSVREWRLQHERAILDELITLVSIPNVSSDRPNIQRNAEFLVQMMKKRNIPARLVSVPGASPVVFGEIKTPGATRTIGFYAHYDGQPVDAKEWASPPFKPTLRNGPVETGGKTIALLPAGKTFNPEWRLYGRGAADDKAPIMAMLSAIDAIRAAGLQLRSNIKFAFEGEEEALSVNLEKILAANKALFAADVWLVCDGPTHQSRQQQIHFGARGVTSMDIVVYGPRVDLHAGHYGNWAPNPADQAAQLVASLRDANDRVLIDGFYDDITPLTETEKSAIAAIPDIDGQLMRDLWLGQPLGAPAKLAELITRPAIVVRGFDSGRTLSQATSIIPSTASISLVTYLVKGMSHEDTSRKIIEHIQKQGFFVVDREPDGQVRSTHAKVAFVRVRPGGYDAVRTSMDLPIAKEVIAVAESVRGPVVRLPNMGGAVPLAMIERPLGTVTIGVPIVNHDNNQHSANENLRLQNLWDGIELMAGLLTM
jgi:acetylornithine deacetylase/succinyl-diaminopimelate desuccinylase-like protein